MKEKDKIDEMPIAFYRLNYGGWEGVNLSITVVPNGVTLSLSKDQERYVYEFICGNDFGGLAREEYLSYAIDLLSLHQGDAQYPNLVKDLVSADENLHLSICFEYFFEYEDTKGDDGLEEDFLDFLKKLNNISHE